MSRSNEHYDYLFKYIIVGDVGVGKTCITRQFLYHEFDTKETSTIGVDYGHKTLSIEGKKIKIAVWDTAGQEAFKSIARSYYSGAAACILVYNITDRNSFPHISDWLEDARLLSGSRMVFALVGNKTDIENNRQVERSEGEHFSRQNDLMFFETSAKTGINVSEVFEELAELLYSKVLSGEIDVNRPISGVKLGRKLNKSEKIKRNVSNCCLKPDINAKCLYEAFIAFGDLISCKVVRDELGVSKGYGYVHFRKEKYAEQCVIKLNGMCILGKKIFISVFMSKKDRKYNILNQGEFTKLYIKNLSGKFNDKDFYNMFEVYGEITSLEIYHVGRIQLKTELEVTLIKKFGNTKRVEPTNDVNVYMKNLDSIVIDERLKNEFGAFGFVTSAKRMGEAKAPASYASNQRIKQITQLRKKTEAL
ncbi:Small GTP-binding protein domain,P-loop containing nucleoside triphosphate hydrolase,Small GTPase [Cinara cedri]|uniref:Small GTP-binding protein domain,P-loop containing nucleoside triphosphate hydrolase,Small GTPase n=1 Tax=Cinara cedri TaxID=506608 RepID=A0A5E4MIX2_9HEMI|nr:Small GTP-binding protein domain,P-loop containing nucleoside triphosphate hydrolase,Small GTPase [Cinara cedri]